MWQVVYQYPGDPPASMLLQFGHDFVRSHPNREIRIRRENAPDLTMPVPATDVVCDLCSRPIAQTDPCGETQNKLYCWPCVITQYQPYFVRIVETKTSSNR